MRVYLLATAIFLGFFFVFSPSSTHATTITQPTIGSSDRIFLTQRSKVIVRTRLGELGCRQGQLYLVKPELKLAYAEPTTVSQLAKTKPLFPTGSLLVTYQEQQQIEVIGPYDSGTEVVFAIAPITPLCADHLWLSTDPIHARLQHHGGGSWTIIWEDSANRANWDFNDLYTEITIIPVATQPSSLPTSPFSAEPHYKLPWPAGVKHMVTVNAGQKKTEHEKITAEDIDMNPNRGDTVVAAEQGVILWIEDSFGTGACPDPDNKAAVNYYRGRANVVVIQTEADVNTTYVHLLQGSVTALGLQPGQHVSQGQPLGKADTSGYACGSHLHFEWQHHCYDLAKAQMWRDGTMDKAPTQPIGKPSLYWSCSAYPTTDQNNPPFKFWVEGKEVVLRGNNTAYTSDNTAP